MIHKNEWPHHAPQAKGKNTLHFNRGTDRRGSCFNNEVEHEDKVSHLARGFVSFEKSKRMAFTFYQIAGDVPGTSIYINPHHVVRVVPNGSNSRIHLSDKTVYDIAQTASIVQAKIVGCMEG